LQSSFHFFVREREKFNKTEERFIFERQFWCGREQNPSLFGVDLKMFFYQPSLIGLFMMILAFLEG
jgi:hypothetical protein